MLIIKPVNKEFKDLEKAHQLLTTLFPRSEQAPLWFLLWRAKRDFVDFLAFYEEDVFVGLAYLITRNDLTFILYLAVCGEVQSKGYGTRILNAIKWRYHNKRLVLNIKAVEKDGQEQIQRQRRRNFYIKNGYKPTGLMESGRHYSYETMFLRGSCTMDEYKAVFRRFTGWLAYPFVGPLFGL